MLNEGTVRSRWCIHHSAFCIPHFFMTHLCVAIFVSDPSQARAEMAQAAEAGADLVELRIDHLTEAALVDEVVRAAPVPTIVTCRPTWEGGHSELEDADR